MGNIGYEGSIAHELVAVGHVAAAWGSDGCTPDFWLDVRVGKCTCPYYTDDASFEGVDTVILTRDLDYSNSQDFTATIKADLEAFVRRGGLLVTELTVGCEFVFPRVNNPYLPDHPGLLNGECVSSGRAQQYGRCNGFPPNPAGGVVFTNAGLACGLGRNVPDGGFGYTDCARAEYFMNVAGLDTNPGPVNLTVLATVTPSGTTDLKPAIFGGRVFETLPPVVGATHGLVVHVNHDWAEGWPWPDYDTSYYPWTGVREVIRNLMVSTLAPCPVAADSVGCSTATARCLRKTTLAWTQDFCVPLAGVACDAAWCLNGGTCRSDPTTGVQEIKTCACAPGYSGCVNGATPL
jgi:hypothetical protein